MLGTRSSELGWGLAVADEQPRPGTTLEALATLRTPFRPHGRVTAGNAAGLNDGATACLLAAESVAAELGLPVAMRLVSFAFAGVDPEQSRVWDPFRRRRRRWRRRSCRLMTLARLRSMRRSRCRCLPSVIISSWLRTIRDSTRTAGPSQSAIRSPAPVFADDSPGTRVPEASRSPLRTHHAVHRSRHGRNRDL